MWCQNSANAASNEQRSILAPCALKHITCTNCESQQIVEIPQKIFAKIDTSFQKRI